jgi:hypothetical protein
MMICFEDLLPARTDHGLGLGRDEVWGIVLKEARA